MDALLDATCAYGQRCKDTIGADFVSVEACRNATLKLDVILGSQTGAGFLDQLKQALIVVDQAKAAECLSDLNTTLACTSGNPVDDSAACRAAYRWLDGRNAGESCSDNFASLFSARCNPGLSCRSTQSQCGVCAIQKFVGESCMNPEECSTHICTNNVCALAPGLGEACNGGCRGSLTCVQSAASSTCQKPPVAGESCNQGCAGGATCVVPAAGGTGTCAIFKDAGSTCDALHDEVPCDFFCQPSSPTTLVGRCLAGGSEMPGNGEACAFTSGSPLCAGGTYPEPVETQPGTITGCACRTVKATGQSCANSAQCATGRCQLSAAGAMGTCAEKLANGGNCGSDTECQSGLCGPNGCEALNMCQ